MAEKKWSPIVVIGSLILISGIICFFLLATWSWTPGASDFDIQLFLFFSSIALIVIGIVVLSIGIWLWKRYKKPAMEIPHIILPTIIILGFIWYIILSELLS